MKDRKRKPDSRKNIVFNIQSIILSVLMAISLVTIIVMGLLLYHRFKLALEKTAVDNTEATVEATVDRLNADLLDIRQIINGANYNVVQQFDISSREFSEQFSLLYETNSDKIQSLALYDPKGNLIASEPVAAEKKNVKVQTQEWYKNAEDAIENIHFSTPHIQELFEDGSYRYQWVVSLSRYVDVNKGETPETGILLLDMKYSVIRDVMKQINDCSGGIYYYLTSQDGEMIYHPRGTELNRGLFEENSLEAAKYEDGTYEIRSGGQNETVIVGSVYRLENDRCCAGECAGGKLQELPLLCICYCSGSYGHAFGGKPAGFPEDIQTDPGAGCFRQGPRGRRKTGYLYRRLLGDPPSGTFCAEVL